MVESSGDQEKKKEVVAKPEEKVVVVKAEEAKPKEAAPVVQKAAEKKVPVINGAANKKANNNNNNNNNSNVTNGVPKTKPTPANNPNNKLKPVKVIPPKAATAVKPKGEIPKIVEPDKEAQKEVTPVEGSSSTSFFDGENWKVTISSKHELATLSDLPHKTVTITPKTPPPEVKKAAAVKQVQCVLETSSYQLDLGLSRFLSGPDKDAQNRYKVQKLAAPSKFLNGIQGCLVNSAQN
jgi:hypothetical protein